MPMTAAGRKSEPMKTILRIGILPIFVVFAAQAIGAGPEERSRNDVEQILELHKAVLEAHKAGDVDGLLAAESDEIVRASRGEVLFPPKSERVLAFTRYLQSTAFEEYRDLIDPIVRVSDDGTLGWLIAQVKIVGTQTSGSGERVRIDSVWAWIELYEKKAGQWYRVGDVSNVRPLSSEESRDGELVPIGTFRQLHSEVLGEDRSLLVCLPRGYEESAMAYPVLFVLYGDQVRGYFAEAVHVVDRLSGEGSIPKMIVVGVANVDRYRDLSPVGRRGGPSGVEPFSRFVVEELMPYVESEYRTKDYRVLMGPQAGAAFGLYTLAKRQGLFDAFIIENPFRSAPVHDLLVTEMEGPLEKGLLSFTFLKITVPDREGHLDKTGEVEYVRNFEKMIAEKEPHNLTVVTHYIEKNEDFVPSLRLKEGLRELFREYRFPDDREVRGLADITAHYAALSERFGFEVDVPEMTLASKADELSETGANDSVMEILEYLVEVYPASVDGYWRLANLHRERGNRELAIEYYRKCLDILPNMRPARDWIERLESQE
jgi:hypothetical protein